MTAETVRMLTSWKEIAGFLGKSVRTVQRWERLLGLPVHRPKKSLSGIVLADPGELEAWLRSQPAAAGAEPPQRCPRCSELEAEVLSLRAKFAALESAALRLPRKPPQRPAA